MQHPQIAKSSPSGHHSTTLSGYIFATKACIDNRKKTLLNSNTSSTCPHNMAAEICKGVSVTISWLRICLFEPAQYWTQFILYRMDFDYSCSSIVVVRLKRRYAAVYPWSDSENKWKEIFNCCSCFPVRVSYFCRKFSSVEFFEMCVVAELAPVAAVTRTHASVTVNVACFWWTMNEDFGTANADGFYWLLLLVKGWNYYSSKQCV